MTDVFCIRFQMEAEEDFHAGDGLGKIGLYDVGQQRELRGGAVIPVVRADTVKGLLRDACRRLVADAHYNAEWKTRFPGVDADSVFAEMFDYRAGDSLQVTALRPVDAGSDPAALFRIVAQTAVSPDTGRAQDRTLRAIECGRAGLVLAGEIRGQAPEGAAAAAEALLLDGLRHLRRLGGQRRRGFGRVRLCEAPQVMQIGLAPAAPVQLDRTHTGPISLLITLEAVEPLHVTGGPQVANLMPGLSYVPGSVLLGALRHEWRVRYRGIAQDPGPVAALLAGHGLSVGSLYPVADGDVLALDAMPTPAPLSWQYPKGSGGNSLAARGVRSLLWEERRTDRDVPLKRLDNCYVQGTRIVAPAVQTNLRNRVEAESGRVEEAGLFSVETIPAGTRLAGRIGFADGAACEAFLGVFGALFDPGKDVWIGIGRGRRPARVIGMEVVAHPDTQRAAPPKRFVLHLTSDLVYRTKYLEWATDLGAVIGEVFGARGYRTAQRFERTRMQRRFSATGGLPGFPAVAIQAGSSYLFERTEDEPGAAAVWAGLQAHAWRGLGEGSAAGFGRYALETEAPDWHAPAGVPDEPAEAAASHREAMFEAAKTLFEAAKTLARDKQANEPKTSQWHQLLRLVRETPREEVRAKTMAFMARDTLGGQQWQRFVKSEDKALTDVGEKLLEGIAQYGWEFVATVVRYQANRRSTNQD